MAHASGPRGHENRPKAKLGFPEITSGDKAIQQNADGLWSSRDKKMNIQRGTKDGEKRDIRRSFFSSFNPEP